MFQVVVLEGYSPVTVYAVRKSVDLSKYRNFDNVVYYYEKEYTAEFLVYSNGWERVDASNYAPYEEN